MRKAREVLNPIDRLDAILRDLYAAMDQLHMILRQKDRGNVPAHFYVPFEIMQINASNPHSNHHRNQAGLAAGGSAQVGMSLFQFSAALSSRAKWSNPDGEAAYNPFNNIVVFAEDFDPKSLFDLFTAYHELHHVRQFHEMLSAIGPEQYFQVVTEAGENFLPHFEVEAWALQLESINLYLDGELARLAAGPITPEKIQHFLHLLNAKPQRADIAESLLKGAQKLFPQGISNGQVPTAFSVPLRQSYGQGKCHLKFSPQYGLQLLDPSDSCHNLQ